MPDDPTSPRDEAAVRRLLAQARHDEPIPDEVAARLEEVLAEQDPAGTRTGSPAAAGTGAGVTSMARRRRHRATAMLVAAVTVVVVGVGLGEVFQPDEEADSAASDSAGASQSRAREVPPDRAEAQPEQGPGLARGAEDDSESDQAASTAPDDTFDGSGETASEGANGADGQLLLAEDPPRVRAETFARDVRGVRRRSQRGAVTQQLQQEPTAAPGFSCDLAELGDLGPGRMVAVRYEQAPALLLLRPRTQQTQVVDLVSCEGGEVLRSVTLSS